LILEHLTFFAILKSAGRYNTIYGIGAVLLYYTITIYDITRLLNAQDLTPQLYNLEKKKKVFHKGKKVKMEPES